MVVARLEKLLLLPYLARIVVFQAPLLVDCRIGTCDLLPKAAKLGRSCGSKRLGSIVKKISYDPYRGRKKSRLPYFY